MGMANGMDPRMQQAMMQNRDAMMQSRQNRDAMMQSQDAMMQSREAMMQQSMDQRAYYAAMQQAAMMGKGGSQYEQNEYASDMKGKGKGSYDQMRQYEAAMMQYQAAMMQ